MSLRVLEAQVEGMLCLLNIKAPNVHRLASIAFWFLDVWEKPEVGVANAPADGA